MHSTNPGTGQHGHRQLGNHLHVEADTITFFYTNIFQHIGKFLDVVQQLLISDIFILFGVIPFPNKSGAVTIASFHMAVKTIIADIQFTTLEPFYICINKINIADCIPFLEPSDPFGYFCPECISVLYRPVINLLILVHGLNVSICRPFRGGMKNFF